MTVYSVKQTLERDAWVLRAPQLMRRPQTFNGQ